MTSDRRLVGLALAWLLIASGADAEPPAFAVDYRLPQGCPTQDEFEALVGGRSPLAHFTRETHGPTVRVDVHEALGVFRGHMSMTTGGSAKRERDVSGETCADVVDALALVTALAIDPHASVAPKLPAARTPPPPPAPAPPTVPPPLAPPPLEPTPPPQERLPRITPPRHAEVGGSPMRWHAGVGLGPTVWTGPAPDALAGGVGFGELESLRTGLLAPSMRVSALVLTNGVFDSPGARFVFATGRVDGCPARLGSSMLSLRACAAVDVGVVYARGIDVLHPLPLTQPWLDVALLLRGRWAPHPAGLYVDVEPGLLLPVTRPTFVYATPRVLVHPVPIVGSTLGVAAGWRFR